METLDVHNLPGPIGIFTDRYIRTHWPEFSEYLDSLYPKAYSLREKLWLRSNNQTERPRCPGCGAELRFLSLSKGYQEYCCMKCRCNSPEYIAKKSGPRKNKDAVQEKIHKTNLERYGVENVFQSKEIRTKIKETFIERYGVSHPSQIQEVKQKIQETYKKHCEENPEFDKNIREAVSKTNKLRYGGTGFASKEIKNKFDATIQKRREKNPDFDIEIKQKIQDTYKKHCKEDPETESNRRKKISEGMKAAHKRNKNNPEFKKQFLEKYKNTYKKHCEENPEFEKQKIEKYLKSSRETYKKHCLEDPEFEIKIKNKIAAAVHNTYIQKCVDDPSYPANIELKKYNTKKQNHSFNTSKIEEQFAEWLTDNNIKFIRQYRSDAYPFACDFYFPDWNLYFEINANWTHGGHPFDHNNPDDIATAEIWKSKNTKYYDNALNVWVNTDPYKKSTADCNNLNWIVVYSNKLNDVIQEFQKATH